MMRLAVIPLVLLMTACGDASAPGNDVNLVANEVIVETEAPAVNAAMLPFAEVNGAHPTAPEPAPIPAKFRGTWGESKTACTDLGHSSRITISGRTIRHPTFVMVGEKVTASANQFSLEGVFEGSDRRAEAQYFLDSTGNELTDGGGGGAVRVRCA